MLKKLILATIVCCSASAIALPQWKDGTYLCKDGNDTIKITLGQKIEDNKMESVVLGGDLGLGNGESLDLPCLNGSGTDTEDGAKIDLTFACNDQMIAVRKKTVDATKDTDFYVTIGIVQDSLTGVQILVSMKGKLNGKDYPLDPQSLPCDKK